MHKKDSLIGFLFFFRKILEQNASKPKKRIVKLSWEITTIYSEILKTIASNNPGRHSGHSDDEDEDEMEAHEDSVKRLRVMMG
jgi:transcription initiation protein SPT3